MLSLMPTVELFSVMTEACSAHPYPILIFILTLALMACAKKMGKNLKRAWIHYHFASPVYLKIKLRLPINVSCSKALKTMTGFLLCNKIFLLNNTKRCEIFHSFGSAEIEADSL